MSTKRLSAPRHTSSLGMIGTTAAVVALLTVGGCSSGSSDSSTQSTHASKPTKPAKHPPKPAAKLSEADASRASAANKDLLAVVEKAHQTPDLDPASALHGRAAKAVGTLSVALRGAPADAKVAHSGESDAERLLLSAQAASAPYWRDLASKLSRTVTSLNGARISRPELLTSSAGTACAQTRSAFETDFPPSSDPAGNERLLDQRGKALQRALAKLERLRAPASKRSEFKRFKDLFATRVKLEYGYGESYRAGAQAQTPESYQNARDQFDQIGSSLDANEKKLIELSTRLAIESCEAL